MRGRRNKERQTFGRLETEAEIGRNKERRTVGRLPVESEESGTGQAEQGATMGRTIGNRDGDTGNEQGATVGRTEERNEAGRIKERQWVG